MSKRVALVTGGSTGIGRAIARQLAGNGFQVLITGRNEDTLKESVEGNANIEYIVADVARTEDNERIFGEVKSRHGRLDVLVNNAGIGTPAPLTEAPLELYDKVFGINVRGLIDATQRAIPLLTESKGSIVNISSIVGNRPMAGFSFYSASKAAVSSLSRAWARELAPQGIRVNVVSPGPIETPIFGKMGLSDEEAQGMAQQISEQVPLGRFGAPDEVANAVSFLTSDQASYVTGANYSVDGGFDA